MIVMPSASEKTMLDFALGVAVPGNQHYKLYVNDVTPDDDSVAVTFTEMSTLGYVEKVLTKTDWATVAGASGQPATSTQAMQVWTFTAGAPVTVYGYFVTDATTGKLLFAERFTNPKTVGTDGDVIKIPPTITNSRT